MEKIKQFIKTPIGLSLSLFIALLLFFVVVIKFMQGANPTTLAKRMQTNEVKPLQGNVPYTTQETLNTLTGQSDNLTHNMAHLKKQFLLVKAQSTQSQKRMEQTVSQEMKALNSENKALKEQVAGVLKRVKAASKAAQANKNKMSYNIGDGSASVTQKPKSDFVWIQDASASATVPRTIRSKTNGFNISSVTTSDSGSLLHPNGSNDSKSEDNLSTDTTNPQTIPMYTIPQNTWLTGVIAEQPLIGIVPVNGEVINPRTVSFTVEAKNLSANAWHLPAVLKGIQGNAVCQGFFAIKRPAVTCNVTSLTFIFEDGRIDTVNAAKDGKLGVVTDLYGNPQISGKLYSNLGFFLAGTTLFAGAEGYGNALSAAQVRTQTGSGLVPNISTIVGSANTYAAGQGLSAAALAAQQWWVQRMKSTFDYVEVPNWNPKTHQLLQLNVKITQSIPLDYHFNARKITYENDIHSPFNNSLD